MDENNGAVSSPCLRESLVERCQRGLALDELHPMSLVAEILR
jgi:hypothetical protein